MNIPGIPGSITPRPASLDRGPAAAHQQQSQRVARPERPGTSPVPAPATGIAASPSNVPAPPGTDPTLWSVLSEEERAFFAKVGGMGPLTYGRMLTGQMAPPAPAVRGGRVDFKV